MFDCLDTNAYLFYFLEINDMINISLTSKAFNPITSTSSLYAHIMSYNNYAIIGTTLIDHASINGFLDALNWWKIHGYKIVS